MVLIPSQSHSGSSRVGAPRVVAGHRAGYFLRCDSALAAMLFVRFDERPSLRAFEAFVATVLLVTRFCALAMRHTPSPPTCGNVRSPLNK